MYVVAVDVHCFRYGLLLLSVVANGMDIVTG